MNIGAVNKTSPEQFNMNYYFSWEASLGVPSRLSLDHGTRRINLTDKQFLDFVDVQTRYKNWIETFSKYADEA